MTRRLQIFFGTFLWMFVVAGSAQTQGSAPTAPPAESAAKPSAPSSSISEEPDRKQTAPPPSLSPTELPRGKVGLVRGVVKRNDPIHDQLVVRAFGGGEIKIAFDPRTRLLSENKHMQLTSIPAGAVVSVDTVIDNGQLFARSVRTGPSGTNAVELDGKILRYDPTRSRLILRDPLNAEGVSLRINPSAVVVDQGRPSSVQSLGSDMLVKVWFSASKDSVSNVEILAKRGDSFAFQGRILSVDLRSRVLALSNNTDQSVRELAFGSLDSASLSQLREGTEVSIQAEFDGDRYNVRSVRPVTANQ